MQDLLILATLIPTVFATKIVSERFGAGYGILVFIAGAAVAGVLAANLGIDIIADDCFDYGVRAKGC